MSPKSLEEDVEKIEREIHSYQNTLDRLYSIVQVHEEELLRINAQLELIRKQRKAYREKVTKLQDLRKKRGETETTPVEVQLREDLRKLNMQLDHLDFQFEEQSEFIQLAKQELDLEKSEIEPKLEELVEKLNSLKDSK